MSFPGGDAIRKLKLCGIFRADTTVSVTFSTNPLLLFLQEEEKKGQPNYEHLEEDLHVLISVDDTEDRAKLRLSKAVEKVKDLLQPVVR